jgi:hypothetical protein
MDGGRFDVWVVKLATRTRRRSLILGAIASFASIPRIVRGQTSLVQLGGECTATDQCAQVGACGGSGPIICADNGYADDGALNCCVGQEQFCGSHGDCCSGLLCLGSHSIDGCGNGWCRPRDTIGVVGRGTACTESAQCSQEEGYVVCSEEGLCCSFEGSRCAVSQQCCGALSCIKDDPTDVRWYSPGTCAYTD